MPMARGVADGMPVEEVSSGVVVRGRIDAGVAGAVAAGRALLGLLLLRLLGEGRLLSFW